MRLILTGGGVGENAKHAFSMFAKQVSGGKVLYIPLAEEEMTYDENFEWFKSQMEPYNITNIDIVYSAEEITIERLNQAEGVFIGGGNAFLLLHLLKSCKAYTNLKNVLKTDKVVLGLSAGTTIFGKDINSCLKDDLKIVANDKNNVGLKDTKGINIFEDYAFFVHYKLKESQLEATKEKVQRILDLGTNVICLPEDANLFVTENQIDVFGASPVEVFTRYKTATIYPNQKIDLNALVE